MIVPIGHSRAFFWCEQFMASVCSDLHCKLLRIARVRLRSTSLGCFLSIIVCLHRDLIQSTFEFSILIPKIFQHHPDMKEAHWQKAKKSRQSYIGRASHESSEDVGNHRDNR